MTRKKIFFVKYHIDVCRFKNMNKILGSVKKKCIFVIYRRAFFKLVKMTRKLPGSAIKAPGMPLTR